MSTSISEQQLVKLCFVLKDGKQVEDASEDMQMAYSSARDHSVEDLISWLDESECLRLRADQLSKKHVFVFEQFAGPAFDHIRTQSSAVLIGPRCLISCFLDNEAIPLGKFPVLTTAMRNLTVCSSGLKAEEKNEISRMVHHMGGYYLDILTAACTHLVASTVKSIKYEKAAEIKLKIMHPEWVKDVWEQSQRKMISATDSAFAKHALPIFYSLTITSTGLSTQKRNQIKQLIEDNGGKYIGAFKSEMTDILILEKNSIGSAKFQGAIRCKKECLSPAWIVDSVEAGYALPVGKYEIRGIKSSTPTKDDAGLLTTGEFNPDCTQLSMISHMNSRNLTVNESMASSMVSQAPGRGSTGETPAVPVKSSAAEQKKKYREVLNQISLSVAKKAGPFLDGCKIYLSGFAPEDKDKLNKILNSGGATRFDELSDGISHMIVGDQVQADFREIRDQKLTPHVMSLQWLVRSIELKAPAPEDDDLTFRPNLMDAAEKDIPEPPSPASKKNLQSMNSTFKRPEVPRKLILDDPKPGPSRISRSEDDVLKQYMQKNTSVQLPPAEPKKAPTPAASPAPPPGSTTQDSEMESQFTEFMFGKTLFIYGFSEEDATQIVSDCENCGGTIVDETYTDTVDYIVIPTCSVGEITFSVKGRETVNCIWLETSIQDGMCYPLEYYFEPILYGEDDPKPLEDEVLVISTYSGAERNYLIALGGTLGAKVEDRLVRKTAPIVICKEATGAKYDAAIKWDLTVVNAEWLRECYKQKRRVNEQTFLVGASKSSPKNITEPPPASTSLSRMSDLPDFSKNACLPTTSTDDVSIDSVFIPPAAPEPPAIVTSVADDPPKENRPGSYKYIVENENKDTSEVEYAFKRLPSPELKKISYEDRMIYSQELQEYGELIQSQLSQRKPFDPGHPIETPPALKHRRLSALTGINSPATPTSNNTSAGSSEYEQLSVTQRVLDLDTPLRDTVYKVLKEAEEKERNLSPRTKKMNELLATPSTGNPRHVKTPSLPECMTKQVTPYGFRPDADQQNHQYHKRKLQVWDQFYQPKQQKDRRKSTPLSEIKRRFWKENLGEEYVNYMESRYSSTQFQPFQPDDGGESQKETSAAAATSEECQPSTSKAGTSRGKEVFRAINESIGGAGERPVVGEKRSRSDDDDDDDDDDQDAGDVTKGNGKADVAEPAAATPVRVNTVEDDQVKRLSDLIAMNKNSAKKMRKFEEETQGTDLPRFDSEMIDARYGPAVGWCDPTEFDRERRFDSGGTTAGTVTATSASDAGKNRMIHKGTPVFALSGVNDELRMELMRKIQQLKGEVSNKPNEYDMACTHILCSKPNRGEKILSGIAAGKWLLCTQYIDDSFTAGHFLNEEQYAWGNPKAKDLPPLEPAENQVAIAAYNWRQKIALEAGKHDGVFTGFRVLLLAPKKQQFIRLLRSGGGHVIDQDPPFWDSELAMMATHCFVDIKKSKISPRDHKALAQAGIAVMNIMYLNSYLTSETLPDPARYRLEI